MGNFVLLSYSCVLLSVLVSTAPACVSALVENRPADSYLNSGYYWPKTLYWEDIRHPPGIYWLVYFAFCGAAIYSGIISILLESRGYTNSLAKTFGGKIHNILTKGFVFAAVSSLLGVGMLLIGISANQLSDVVQSYLIGMCMIQVVVDTLRNSKINKGGDTFVVTGMTIESFQMSAVFGFALLDSYRPLNQLNAAYSVGAVLVAVTISKVNSENPGRNYTLGLVASILQLLFCFAAYGVAKQVDGVNLTQIAAFLITAIINFLIVTLAQSFRYCCCRHNKLPHEHPQRETPLHQHQQHQQHQQHPDRHHHPRQGNPHHQQPPHHDMPMDARP